jgi:hypothetical protein
LDEKVLETTIKNLKMNFLKEINELESSIRLENGKTVGMLKEYERLMTIIEGFVKQSNQLLSRTPLGYDYVNHRDFKKERQP